MRPARKDSYHVARSTDTQPASLMTMTLPRRGVTTSIAVHPSFRQPALSLDLCNLLEQISPASSGWNWIACIVAPRVWATRWNSGVLKSRPCVLTQSVQHAVIDCNIYKAPDGVAGLRCPDAATRSWLEVLNIEIWRNGKRLYIYTSRHVTSRHFTSRHVTSRHFTSRHVTSRHVTSRHVTSRHVTSRHITSPHITSHHIISYHIISYHIISYHIISYHIISSPLSLRCTC